MVRCRPYASGHKPYAASFQFTEQVALGISSRMPAAPSFGKGRDIAVVTAAQFSLAFALNFMFVFLPFYVQAISPLDEAATLRWTGLIVGAASAMATFGSAFWGNLTDRFSPKTHPFFQRLPRLILKTRCLILRLNSQFLGIRILQG